MTSQYKKAFSHWQIILVLVSCLSSLFLSQTGSRHIKGDSYVIWDWSRNVTILRKVYTTESIIDQIQHQQKNLEKLLGGTSINVCWDLRLSTLYSDTVHVYIYLVYYLTIMFLFHFHIFSSHSSYKDATHWPITVSGGDIIDRELCDELRLPLNVFQGPKSDGK